MPAMATAMATVTVTVMVMAVRPTMLGIATAEPSAETAALMPEWTPATSTPATVMGMGTGTGR
jgi:hypothetical protein